MAKLLDENSLRAVKTYVDGTFVTRTTDQNITGDKAFTSDSLVSSVLKFQTKDAQIGGSTIEIGRIYGMYDTETSTRTLMITQGDSIVNVSVNGSLWASSVGTTSINPGENDLLFSNSGVSFRPNHTYGNSNLGSSTYRWGSLYLASNLYLAGSIIDNNGNSKTLAELIAGSTTANPTLAGTEGNLTSIQINQTKYNVVQWDSAPTSGHGAGYAVTSEGVATAIANAVSSVYRFKGSVASFSNLPSSGLTIGDVYNVEDTGANYAWDGSEWDELGGDVSNYVTVGGGSYGSPQVITGTKQFNNLTMFGGGIRVRTIYAPNNGDVIIDTNAGALRPNFDGTNPQDYANLGTSTYKWTNLYLSGSISDGTNSVTISQLLPLNQGVATEQEALAILQGNA